PTGAPTVHSSSDVPKAIPDDNPTGATSNLPITGQGTVVSVKVKLSITHTYDQDLTIWLISPTGTRVELSAQNGSSGHNYTNTVFDDSASISIVNGSPPFTGRFKPEVPLSVLAGTTVSGTWKLFVVDGALQDIGTIDQWSLDLQPSVGQCAVFPPPTVTSIN